jgi:hypothetical protein
MATAITLAIAGEIILFSFFMVWSTAKAIEAVSNSGRIPLFEIALVALAVAAAIFGPRVKDIRKAQSQKATVALAANLL